MSSLKVKSCAFLMIVVFLVCAFSPLCSTTGATKTAPRHVQPMVSSPSGSGPYTISYIDDTIRFKTKAYDTTIRIYYPANSSAVNAGVNRSNAPYPCIDWFPGTGGDHTSYAGYLVQMASWGFLVAAWDISVNDWPNNGNTTDLNEFLDHLELRNATPADKLAKMIDKEAFGLAGHSAGGGLTFADGGQVARIKVGVTFSAAMSDGVVDGYGPGWKNKKILMQVGSTDAAYKEPSEYAKYQLTGIHNFVEIWGGDHQCWQNVPYLFHAYFLYWLGKQYAYFPYIFGQDTVTDFVNGVYDLVFLYNSTYYFPPKIANITANPMTVYEDSRVDFNAGFTGYYLTNNFQCQFMWDFNGDGTFESTTSAGPAANYTYTNVQTYAVAFQYKMANALTLKPAAPLTVIVKNVLPVAVAGKDVNIKEDDSVLFDASGSHDTVSDNDTLQYKWDFGDGAKADYSLNFQARHTYTKPGSFKVILSVKDKNGGIATSSLKVNVTNVLPFAQAGTDVTTDEDHPVQLSGKGSDTPSDNATLQFRWDLGNGNSTDWSSTTDCTATYQQAGNYTAKFHVRDVHGAEVNSTLVVHVNNVAPKALVSTPSDGDPYNEDETVSFSGSGTDTQSDVALGLQYKWDFGDGKTSGWTKDPTASHAYTTKGNKKVNFTVKDDDGATDYQLVTITISDPAPVVKIDNEMKKAPNEDEVVMFHGTATDTASDIGSLTYLWDLGDGTNASGTYVNHTYTVTKSYTVTLTVTDNEGAKGTASVTFSVTNVKPTAAIAADKTVIKAKETVSFSSNGTKDTESDIKILKFSWTFGDGTNSADPNPTHTYATAGTYPVTFTVTDDEGATATQTLTVTVQATGGGGGGGGGGNNGNGGSSNLLLPLLVAVIVIIVVILLVVLMLRRKKAAPSQEAPMPKEKYPDQPTTVSKKSSEAPPAPPTTEKAVAPPKEGAPRPEEPAKGPK